MSHREPPLRKDRRYLAQVIPGLQEVAWEHLSRSLQTARLATREEGLLVFDSQAPQKKVAALNYLNNAYLVIREFSGLASITAAVKWLTQSDSDLRALRTSFAPQERSFRLVLSDENQLVGSDRDLVAQLNAKIQQRTGLRRSPRGAQVEYWLLRRRSGRIYFLRRISHRARTEKNLEKGELRPEVAHLLCLLSEPRSSDIFLDPFAGSGAIPFARTFYAYNIIFAFDQESSRVDLMKKRKKDGEWLKVRKGAPLIVRQADSQHLDRIDNHFIDKVVADPPWGHYDDSIEDLESFYLKVLQELGRVVKPGGLLVLLLGDRDLPARLSSLIQGTFELIAQHDLLLSGKKATVSKWRRI